MPGAAYQAAEHPGSCRLCLVLMIKSLRRSLAHQASLKGLDPYLSTTWGVKGEKGWTDADPTALPDTISWGTQLDLADSPLEDDVLDLDYGEDDIISDLLLSEAHQPLLPPPWL